jgi:hypothetical protein
MGDMRNANSILVVKFEGKRAPGKPRHMLELIPWCRILFEKLIVTQLVKKYPFFLRNPKVHHRVHKSPPLDPIHMLEHNIKMYLKETGWEGVDCMHLA